MSASYAETLPTDRDWVRWRLDDRGVISDGDGNPIWIRQNEEIDALLTIYADRRETAADLAESMAIELSKRVDSFTDEDGMSVRWSQRVTALQKTAAILRKQLLEAAIAAGALALGSTQPKRIEDEETAEYVSRPAWGW